MQQDKAEDMRKRFCDQPEVEETTFANSQQASMWHVHPYTEGCHIATVGHSFRSTEAAVRHNTEAAVFAG